MQLGDNEAVYGTEEVEGCQLAADDGVLPRSLAHMAGRVALPQRALADSQLAWPAPGVQTGVGTAQPRLACGQVRRRLCARPPWCLRRAAVAHGVVVDAEEGAARHGEEAFVTRGRRGPGLGLVAVGLAGIARPQQTGVELGQEVRGAAGLVGNGRRGLWVGMCRRAGRVGARRRVQGVPRNGAVDVGGW